MALSMLLVTGQSGSGKSTAVHTLEDRGYYCVDNIPVALVEQLVAMVSADGGVERLALVMDARERRFVREGPLLVTRLRESGLSLRVVYLEAKEESLIRRYSETRRAHPLDDGCGLRVAIAREREILAPLRELADETIDTSGMTPHQLRAQVAAQLVHADTQNGLRLALLTFGFKNGLPLEADIVFDVRFLPNPYFVPALRERSGLDDEVSRYALGSPAGAAFVEQAANFLTFLVPQYQREGKRYLTVAVGCTGGRHRSVAVARELARRLSQEVHVDLRHRDLEETRT